MVGKHMLATWAAVYEMSYKLIKSSCGCVGQMLAHIFQKAIFQQAWRIGLWHTEHEHDLMCGKEINLQQTLRFVVGEEVKNDGRVCLFFSHSLRLQVMTSLTILLRLTCTGFPCVLDSWKYTTEVYQMVNTHFLPSVSACRTVSY